MDGSSASYNYISNAITMLKLVQRGLNEKIVANLLGHTWKQKGENA
jgi:hypothetical protein